MSPRGEVSADTRARQERVSDPAVSAWVSANAGSGKTTVLVRRVIRLLLAGNPPSRILCLTFTKAAAANMANKVLGTLADWVRLDDEALARRLAAITPEQCSPALRSRARRLFAAALETPGGLKVQTIHAFCDRVLHQFPLEADVPAGFEVLDDLQEEELLRRARDAVLINASENPEGDIGRALATVVASASDDSFGKALGECVRSRRKLKIVAELGSEALAQSFGLRQGTSVAGVIGEILDGSLLPQSGWGTLAATLQEFGGNAKKCAERFLTAHRAKNREALVECYFAIFFTGEGGLRDDSGFAADKVRQTNSDLFDRIFEERKRVAPLRDKLFAARALERTAALLRLAHAVMEKFDQAKRERGALDYGDLIDKTADMLNRNGSGWVLYKLDGGIDHVLVDEAQDTSPEQWSVIEKLTEEFFAGKGAREDRERTIFAVGDEKQSIFSFQGAEPGKFDEKRKTFKELVEGAGGKFQPATLNLSFRSAPGVLQAIDTVFSRTQANKHVSSDSRVPPHEAIRSKAPALVEIWDTEKPTPDDGKDLPWYAPLNATSEASPTVKLAQRIARAVKNWTEGELVIQDRDTGELRVPHAGDVIVLVRRRGPLFDAILQELKSIGLTVAGADRLKLYDHIAVMDLAALGDALLLEADDLALACVLKSPLFNLSEDDLFLLAHQRKSTLMAALREYANGDARLAEAETALDRWRKEAVLLRPFDFYSRVLGRDRGREKILARLGHEAADAIDEFLARTLAYEQIETPSLTGFLSFLRRAGTEVKRDLEVESKTVRVMTVHGAKGLEAPLVILADTTSIPDGSNTRLHDIPDSKAFVWAGKTGFDSSREMAAREEAKDAREAEYRRLLYVALTRAADALIVCGAEGKDKLKDGCWYRLVRDALEAGEPSALIETETNYGTVLRWRPQEMKAATRKDSTTPADVKIPAVLERPAPAAKRPSARKHPSDYDEKYDGEAAEKSAPRARAMQRGDLMHRLLEFIPAQPEAVRRERAMYFLKSAAIDFTPAEQEKLMADALAVIAHPGMAPLLGAQSLPEVPFLYREPNGDEISGRIDRLYAKGEEVIFVDYKTDAVPPKTPAQVPERYRTQLLLYRKALQAVFPGKTIRTLLAYTTGPLVHDLSGAVDDGSPRCDAP